MWIQQIGKLRMLFYKKSKLVFYFSDKIVMYHFHAAEKSAHAFWQVARKHVNTQYLVYYKSPNQPPPPLAK